MSRKRVLMLLAAAAIVPLALSGCSQGRREHQRRRQDGDSAVDPLGGQ